MKSLFLASLLCFLSSFCFAYDYECNVTSRTTTADAVRLSTATSDWSLRNALAPGDVLCAVVIGSTGTQSGQLQIGDGWDKVSFSTIAVFDFRVANQTPLIGTHQFNVEISSALYYDNGSLADVAFIGRTKRRGR